MTNKNFWIYQKLLTFELLLTHNSNDAINDNKKQREPTGASPAVNHLHRKCVGSRDSLPFINQIFIFMLPTNDERGYATPIGLLSPEQILNDLMISDDLPAMRNNLREMMEQYLLREDDARYRHAVFGTYKVLDILLSRVENINNKGRRAA